MDDKELLEMIYKTTLGLHEVALMVEVFGLAAGHGLSPYTLISQIIMSNETMQAQGLYEPIITALAVHRDKYPSIQGRPISISWEGDLMDIALSSEAMQKFARALPTYEASIRIEDEQDHLIEMAHRKMSAQIERAKQDLIDRSMLLPEHYPYIRVDVYADGEDLAVKVWFDRAAYERAKGDL